MITPSSSRIWTQGLIKPHLYMYLYNIRAAKRKKNGSLRITKYIKRQFNLKNVFPFYFSFFDFWLSYYFNFTYLNITHTHTRLYSVLLCMCSLYFLFNFHFWRPIIVQRIYIIINLSIIILSIFSYLEIWDSQLIKVIYVNI